MSGNHSRFSHQWTKRYSALNLVQGAMVTDADQMESQSITARLAQDQGRLTMRSGIPGHDGILTYDPGAALGAASKLKGFRPGRLVANGRTAELRLATGQTLTGNGFDIFEKQLDLLGGPALPTGAAEVAVYGDVFDRHAGPAEDPRMLDAAFLAAETAVRKERVAQLKFAAAPAGSSDDALRLLVHDPQKMPATGDLRLTAVDFASAEAPKDDCDPCAAAVTDADLEAGNDLFRLEVHDSAFKVPEVVAGPELKPATAANAKVTLKWSRDNGGIEVPAAARDQLLADAAFANAVFELADLASEQRMGLASTAAPRTGQLLDRAGLAAVASAALANKIVRVWEGAAVIDLSAADLAPVLVGASVLTGSIVKTAAAWEVKLVVSGLSLTLVGGVRGAAAPFVLPGDAWCVEVREFATSGAQRLIWEAEPVEVRHDYVYIGRVASGAFVNPPRPDLRAVSFPALTELAGENVLWSNQYHTGVDANTVQDAIDLLFARDTDGCQCTFLIDPKRPLFVQLKEIAAALAGGASPAGALICFPAGEWILEESFAFVSVPELVLRGSGAASRIVAHDKLKDLMLAFENCGSVLIEDLAIDNRAPDSRGSLHAVNVRQLRLNRLTVVTDGREEVEQFAVLVEDMRDDGGLFPGDVGVSGCRFNVGTSNTGLVVAGSCRLVVSDCQFHSPLKLAGTFGKYIGFGNYAIEKARFRQATPLEIHASEGRLVPVEKLSQGIVIDLGDVDPDYREDAVKFWTKGIEVLGPEEGVTSLEQTEALRSGLSTVMWAAKSAGFQAMERLSQAPDATVTLSSDAPDMKLLKSISGVAETAVREVVRTMSGTLSPSVADPAAPIELSPRLSGMLGRRFLAMPRTGGTGIGGPPGGPGQPEPPVVPPRPPGSQPDGGWVLPTRKSIFDIEIELPWKKEKKFTDIVPDFGKWFGGEAGTFQADSLSFGIDASLSGEVMTEVTGNRFSGLDVAIRIAGPGKRVSSTLKDVPVPTVIRDNAIVRAPRGGVVSGGKDEYGTHYPITLIGCGNLHVSHNTVQQIPDSTVDDKYLEAIADRKLPQADLRFAAIAIGGATGNHVHVTANTAFLFRHAVLVTATSRAPGNKNAHPDNPLQDLGWPNYWIFQHNLVSPNYERLEKDKWANWAVRIPSQEALQSSVVLLRTPNHPEPPANET